MDINLSEPWKKSDVPKHRKNLTDTQKERWVKAANEAYKSCMNNGGTDKKCAQKAIRIANSLFSKESNSGNMQRLKDYLQKLEETGAKYTSQSRIDVVKNQLQETITNVNNQKEVSENEKREIIEQAKDILEAERTFRELGTLLRDALKRKYPHFEYGPFLEDFTNSEVIYEDPHDKLWKAPYQIQDGGVISIGDPIEVYKKISYEQIGGQSNESRESNQNNQSVKTELQESIDIVGEPCNIVEAKNGSNLKLIKI